MVGDRLGWCSRWPGDDWIIETRTFRSRCLEVVLASILFQVVGDKLGHERLLGGGEFAMGSCSVAVGVATASQVVAQAEGECIACCVGIGGPRGVGCDVADFFGRTFEGGFPIGRDVGVGDHGATAAGCTRVVRVLGFLLLGRGGLVRFLAGLFGVVLLLMEKALGWGIRSGGSGEGRWESRKVIGRNVGEQVVLLVGDHRCDVRKRWEWGAAADKNQFATIRYHMGLNPAHDAWDDRLFQVRLVAAGEMDGGGYFGPVQEAKLTKGGGKRMVDAL